MLVEGVIASAPDAQRRVTVTIPTFHPEQTFGPCPYMPRGGALPTVGARCLVALDETGIQEPWVPAWDGPDGAAGGTYIPTSEKAAANGVATLDSNTHVPNAQLGAGTVDPTKFLRGDRTWAAPPGAGTDAAWQALTPISPWANYGAGWDTLAYALDGSGHARLRGMVVPNGATDAQVGTLPTGARPPSHKSWPVVGYSAGTYYIGDLQALSTGEIVAHCPGATDWIALGEHEYRIT